MENPFETLNNRIDRLEKMLAHILSLIEALPDARQELDTHDRRKPATREKAAEYLGISVGTVDNLVRSKQLKATRIGKAVRFRWEALDDFVSKRSK